MQFTCRNYIGSGGGGQEQRDLKKGDKRSVRETGEFVGKKAPEDLQQPGNGGTGRVFPFAFRISVDILGMVKCGGQQRKEPFKKGVHSFFILWEMSSELPPDHPAGRESSFPEVGTKGMIKVEKDPEFETGIGRNGMKGLLRSP